MLRLKTIDKAVVDRDNRIMEKYSLTQSDAFLKNTYGKALIPCMLSILSSNINILVDGIIVGQKLGMQALAALNLCIPVYLGLCVIGSFIVSGCAVAAASAIGRDRMEEAQRYYRFSTGLCLTAAAVVMVIAAVAPDAVVSMLCKDEALYGMVKIYTVVTLWGAAPKIVLYVPFWFLRLDGRNSLVTAVMTIMAAGNIILDVLFLYVFEMGILGAALASVIATAAAVLAGFIFLCDKRSGFRFGMGFRPGRGEWSAIVKNGTPAALNNLMQTLRVFAVNHILLLYGNTMYVAMFAAVNCIGEFSLCLIQGVPQAAAAMLGVYCGERDNGSSRILMKLQWRYGLAGAVVFGLIITACADLIAGLYGLERSLTMPMFCLSLSIFPGLFSSIMAGYYNVSDHAWWSDLIIACRVFLFPAAALLLLHQWNLEPWVFMVIGEAAALLFWYACIQINHRRHPGVSPYLMMDDRLEQERKTLDFSVKGNVEDICSACEKISDFCETNGMSMKQVMRMSLSMEELMTMIVKVNDARELSFDIRLYAIRELKGIRMLYNGKEYNPFAACTDLDNSEYLGVRMIYKMVENVVWQKTFGMNMLRISI